MHDKMQIINKWQQMLDEVKAQIKHLIIMDSDDEMLFVELNTKQQIIQQILTDLNTCQTL